MVGRVTIPAAVAAEVHEVAGHLQARRRSVMATCIPHTGSVATATTRGRGRRGLGPPGHRIGVVALRPSGPGSRSRSRRACGRRCRAPRGVQLRGELLGHIELGPDRRRRAWGWPPAPRSCTPARSAAEITVSSPLPCEATITAAAPASSTARSRRHCPGRRAQHVVARRLATARCASAIGEPPTITRARRRAAAARGRSPAPRRSDTGCAPPPRRRSRRRASASPSSGTSRSSIGSPVSIARSECSRTDDSAQTPPTNPSIVAVGADHRRVARADAGGPPGTDDGRQHERLRSAQQAARTWMRDRPESFDVTILPLHRVPHARRRARHVDVPTPNGCQRVARRR